MFVWNSNIITFFFFPLLHQNINPNFFICNLIVFFSCLLLLSSGYPIRTINRSMFASPLRTTFLIALWRLIIHLTFLYCWLLYIFSPLEYFIFLLCLLSIYEIKFHLFYVCLPIFSSFCFVSFSKKNESCCKVILLI